MSTSPQHRLLIIGCGSIGERHVRTFLSTRRAQIIACDTRPAILAEIAHTYGVATITDWRDSLADQTITGAVIATPAPLHVPVGRQMLAAGRHVLIEKPLALELIGTDALIADRDRAGKFAALAYVLHFVPALQGARAFLSTGAFGAIRHVAVNSGEHFPFYRPAYREIYYSDHAQGGGAIQDALTHLANAVEWIVGPGTRVFCDAAHQVLEGVSVEDTVTVSARHGDVLASYSLNQFQAPSETRFDFHAETGSVRVESHAQRWGTRARGAADWTWNTAPVTERDQLFVAQAHAFLDGAEGRPTPLCSLEEGIQTLRFNLAALQSWRENRPVTP